MACCGICNENAVQPEVWRDVVSEAISCKVLGEVQDVL